MLSINFIEKIIGYQEVIIKNIEEANENLYVHMMMKRKECVCPVCRKKISRVHDYLLKRECKLSTEEHRQVNIMLYASAELSTAYFLKEKLYKVLDEVENPDNQ